MTTADSNSTQPSANPGRPAGRLERLLRSRLLGHGLFWSWNAIFIVYAGFGLLPVVVSPMVRDALHGRAPIDLAAAMLSVLAVPVGATVWGVFLRRDPERLLRLFYGLEMPLFFLCVGRVFLVREATAPLTVLAGAAAIGWGAFAIDLLHPAADARSRVDWPVLIGFSVLVAITAYIGLLTVFYAVPGLVAVPKGLLEMLSGFGRSGEAAPLAVLAVIVLAFASTLLLVLPVAATLLYLGAWLRTLRRHTRLYGKRVTNTVASFALALFPIVLLVSGSQPQRQAFSLLEHLPTSDAERQQLLDHSAFIRRGLLNAYLAPQRYLASTEGSRRAPAAALLWAHTFGGTPERYELVQKVHDFLATPILYDGDSRIDGPRAEHEYEQFFDEPLQKAERSSVNHALSATWRRDRPQAGLLDRDAAVVHATEQTVTVREMGALAEIELHECYQNLTPSEQEVLLHFSLPEDSAITGLWLGSSADRDQADAFVVAPRGAAQRVYNGEVRASFDPALIEQVGPRQFRLRAFPIPGNGDQGDAEPRRMHVWLKAVVADRAGRWPLPRLLEKRNVFWDSGTRRQLVQNDGPATLPPVDGRGWLPASIARRSAAPAQDQVAIEAQVQGLRVRVTPVAAPSPNSSLGRRYVVVVDRSRSMERHRAALNAELRWLSTQVAADNQVDAFLPAAPSRGEEGRLARLCDLDAGRIVFYGGQPLGDMLNQLQERTAGQEYDAVILLTDDGGYDLEPPDAPPLSLAAPLWIVHVDEALPVGYSDVVTRLLTRASSGIASSAADAFAHLAVSASMSASTSSPSGGGRMLAGDHLVETAPTSAPDSGPSPASAYAARAAIAMLSSEAPRDNETLDKLHAIARQYGVVTPYSSMIVLVNERQRENLDKASASATRFNRTVESGKQGSEWVVSGVPEPEEWALILLASALLGRLAWRARPRHQPAGS